MKNKLKQTTSNFKDTRFGSFIRNVYNFLQIRFYYYTHLQILINDLIRLPYLRSKDAHKYSGTDFSANRGLKHLQAAMDWLCYAQDVNKDGGVAASYNFRRGWEASYPETTGYIIPTFFDYYHFTSKEDYKKRALKMADWLVSIQMRSGAYQGGTIDQMPHPEVFNTGQIVQGLIRAYKEVGKEIYIKSAQKAGDWLVEMQDSDGAWRKYVHNDIPHSYYTRVAWPLLELYQITLEQSYKQSAMKNLQLALNNQDKNGWFKCNAFDTKTNPYTHTIIYAARGMLESAVLLNDSRYIESADRVAKVLFKKFEIFKFLQGDFDERWQSQSCYSCLTGNAQLSILVMRLYELRKDERYLNTALKINEYLRSTHDLNNSNYGIRGGIKGSDPIWGNYASYSYPNWAAKFFADSLMLEEKILKSL